MTGEERATTLVMLGALKLTLDELQDSFKGVIEMAEAEQALGLAFSAKMLQESIASFKSELSRFVLKRIAEE